MLKTLLLLGTTALWRVCNEKDYTDYFRCCHLRDALFCFVFESKRTFVADRWLFGDARRARWSGVLAGNAVA